MTRTPEPRPPRGLIARIAQLEPAPPWGWGAALGAAAIAVIAIIGASLFVAAVLGVESYTIYLGWLAAGLLTAYWIASTRRGDRDRAAMRLIPSPVPLPFLLFLMIGLAVSFDLISLGVTGQFLPVMELFTFDITNAAALDWLFAVGFMVVAQPVGEELLFRGVLFPLMRAQFGAWAGLLINAAAYGLFHLAMYTSQVGAVEQGTLIWYGFALPFLDGLVFAAVRAYTGSTRAAIFAHAAFGLFAVLKLFALTG
ncbi:MAG: CPBP family intramembrane glutamic endopeptidase [bacterium]|nr:CPBP family intramembrane glutamic endopeptidase [bacterium]